MSAPLTLASTYRLALTANKDGAVWDLTGAAVSLLLRKPDGALVTKSATLVSAAAGTARVDLATTDLDTLGAWSRSWKVVQGAVSVTSAGVPFAVVRAP